MLFPVIRDAVPADDSRQTKSLGRAASSSASCSTCWRPGSSCLCSACFSFLFFLFFNTLAGTRQQECNSFGLSLGACRFQQIFRRLDLDDPELPRLRPRLPAADPTVDTLSRGFISSSAVSAFSSACSRPCELFYKRFCFEPHLAAFLWIHRQRLRHRRVRCCFAVKLRFTHQPFCCLFKVSRDVPSLS